MNFLLDIVFVLILARLLGELFNRAKLPLILGYLLAGFLAGPLFHIVEIGNIHIFGEIGLILLLFIAGFKEVSTEMLLKEKKFGLSIGILGSLIPFGLGYLVGQAFGFSFINSLLIGVALSATSISISLASFIEMGKLNTRTGRSLIGAAIVDDIIALLLLAFVSSIVVTGGTLDIVSMGRLFGGMLAFLVVFVLGAKAAPYIFRKARKFRTEEMRFSLVFVLVIFIAYLAQEFGLSTVIGAFVAGIILSRVSTLQSKRFSDDVKVVSEGIFIPFFFAFVGMQIVLDVAVLSLLPLAILVVAFAGKFLGAWLGSLFGGLKKQEIMGLSFGMVPRGEVALVVITLGKSLIPGFPNEIFSSILIMIIVTIFVTPVILERILKKSDLPK